MNAHLKPSRVCFVDEVTDTLATFVHMRWDLVAFKCSPLELVVDLSSGCLQQPLNALLSSPFCFFDLQPDFV